MSSKPTSRPDISAASASPERKASIIARITKNSNGCWLLPCTTGQPYSIIRFKRVQVRAHRAFKIWEMGSKFEFDKIVCHLCEYKNCVNPSHNYLGTHWDNTQDRVHAGITTAKKVGEDRKNAKLTAKIAREIYQRCADPSFNRASLAQSYGVTKATIYSIVKRQSWKHATIDLPVIKSMNRDYFIKGSQSHHAVLDEDTVRKICESLISNLSVAAVARKFGISWHHAHKIKNRQAWRHVSSGYDFDKNENLKKATVYKKLCPNDVIEIRRLYAKGIKQTVIAQKFSIGYPLVSRIVRRITWPNIE